MVTYWHCTVTWLCPGIEWRRCMAATPNALVVPSSLAMAASSSIFSIIPVRLLFIVASFSFPACGSIFVGRELVVRMGFLMVLPVYVCITLIQFFDLRWFHCPTGSSYLRDDLMVPFFAVLLDPFCIG